MENQKLKKPGGDKTISRLRNTGDVLELTVIGILAAASIIEIAVISVRVLTDLKVSYNKKKMKGGNR